MVSGASGIPGDAEFQLDPHLEFTDPRPRRALEYWDAKRGARAMPARADIDPRELKHLLPYVQILDVIDGGRAIRPRLIGSASAKRMNPDPTGQVFDETSPRLVVRRTLVAVRWSVHHRKPLRTFAAHTALEGQEFLAHETVFLPLSHDEREVDMIALVGVFLPAN
jgi:hypothetical protein